MEIDRTAIAALSSDEQGRAAAGTLSAMVRCVGLHNLEERHALHRNGGAT